MAEFDWLGSLLGAAAGYAGNRSSNTQTQTNSVSPEFSPLASSVAARGQQFGEMPYTPYDFNRVSDFSPYQFQGFDMAANRATQGALPQQAESALSNTIGGGYMGNGPANPYAGANPYLEKNIQNTLGDVSRTYNQTVAPTMAANAYQSGSFGNSGQKEMEDTSRDMLQRNLGRISGDMRMQDYGMQQGLAENGLNRNQSRFDSERNRMMQGLSMAPGINQLGYSGADKLMGIGGTMQQQGQNVLDSQYSDFQTAQTWPFKTYDAMMAPFGRGVAGGQSTSSWPSGNPVAGLFGGAMLGNQLFGGMGGSSPTGINNYGLPNWAMPPG